MRPRYLELQEFDPSLQIEEVDFDDHPELVQVHKIGTTLPVAIFIDETGEECGRLIGEYSRKKLRKFLEKL